VLSQQKALPAKICRQGFGVYLFPFDADTDSDTDPDQAPVLPITHNLLPITCI